MISNQSILFDQNFNKNRVEKKRTKNEKKESVEIEEKKIEKRDSCNSSYLTQCQTAKKTSKKIRS